MGMDASSPLTLRFRPGLRLSDEAFARLCRANPDLRLERGARGDLQIMPPAGTESGMRNADLLGQLWAWNRARGLGVVIDSSGGFTLPDGAIRSPDAAWIAADRWAALPAADRAGFARICPDFVAEIRSPSDSPGALRKKMRAYVRRGVRLAWLLDPLTGTAEVYRPGRPVETLDRPASLPGEDVLPAFTLDLGGILPHDPETRPVAP